MASPTVFPKNDPRRRTLLGTCLVLCCGFFVLELIVFLFVQELLRADGGFFSQILQRRFGLFSLGRSNVVIYCGVGLLMHAGIAAFMSVILQQVWLRNRRLAVSVALLIFVAFQGSLMAIAMGEY